MLILKVGLLAFIVYLVILSNKEGESENSD